MGKIGIFTRLAAIGQEVKHPVFAVNRFDAFAVVRAGSDLVFEFARFVVEVKMSPTILFRPMNVFFAAVDEAQVTGFHIGIQTFFNQGFYGAQFGVGYTDVDAFEVAAGAGEVELIRIRGQPQVGLVIIIAVFGQAWSTQQR